MLTINLTDEQKECLRLDLQTKCGTYYFGDEIDTVIALVEKYLRPVSFSKAIRQNPEEVNLDDPHFKGETYEKDIDQKALKEGFSKVFRFMAEHDGWHLDTEIADATGVYVPSVQRYRSYCRAAEWGGHTVERRRREGCRVFEYRLIPNRESLVYKKMCPSS